MYSIGKFSQLCRVSIKTLRYYDRIGLVQPHFIDPSTGYRYYTDEQTPTILLIARLKRYGFQLSQIESLLHMSVQEQLLRLMQQECVLRDKISQANLTLQDLMVHIERYKTEGNIMSYQEKYIVTTADEPDRAILSIRQKMSVHDFGRYYGQLFDKIAAENVTVNGPFMAIYWDEEFDPEGSDIELAAPIAESGKATRVLPGGLCCMTVHAGGYSSLNEPYAAIVQWMGQNGYISTNAPYERYDVMDENISVEKWRTSIYFPAKKDPTK